MPPKILSYDERPVSLSWILDEPMQRASHALCDDGRVWLVDPVDVPEAVERALALGRPVGVIQLLDRHGRANEELAERLGVPHLRLPDRVPDSPFEVLRVVDVPKWRERALWWPAQRTLVVAEALGTGPMFRPAEGAAVGVHLFLRLRPPGALRDLAPEHVLFGHGAGVHGPGAAAAVREAYARSLRDLPRVVARLPSAMR